MTNSINHAQSAPEIVLPTITWDLEVNCLAYKGFARLVDKDGNDACLGIKEAIPNKVSAVIGWLRENTPQNSSNLPDTVDMLGIATLLATVAVMIYKRKEIVYAIKWNDHSRTMYEYWRDPELLPTVGRYNPDVLIESINEVLEWKQYKTDLTANEKFEFWIERDIDTIKDNKEVIVKILESMNEKIEKLWMSKSVKERAQYILSHLKLPTSKDESDSFRRSNEIGLQLDILFWILERAK